MAAGHWVAVIAPTIMVQPTVTHLPTAAIQEPTVPVLLTADLPTAVLHRRVPIAAVAAVALVAVAPSAAEVAAEAVALVVPLAAADVADNK